MDNDLLIKIMADWALFPAILITMYALIINVKNKNKIRVYSQIVIAGLLSYLIAKFSGVLYQSSSARPFELLGLTAGASFLDNPGFPSDHALFTTAMLGAVWFSTKQKILSAILLFLLVIISIGRVLALVHTPIDIIGGIIFGVLGALWYLNDPRSNLN